MAQNTETRRFSLHPDVIYSVIHAQSGSLSKAFMEIVQNSVDAGATRIEIKIDGKEFTAVDDGKGFTCRKEIEEWFEVFGTPHKEGDARFGRFRMGRGQIFSFSANRWETGAFVMDVDVKNRGLDYDLSESKEVVFKGCRITGSFYDALLPSELDHTIRDLSEQVVYVDVPVLINGKVVNQPPSQAKWDVETDDAWFKFKQTRGLRVYNMGVFVREFPADQFGCSGVVVSKDALNVNYARNDILVSRCDRWKRVRAVLAKHARKENLGSKRLDDSARQHLIRQLCIGDIKYSEVSALKLITLANGTKIALRRLEFSLLPVTVSPSEGSRVADMMITRKEAVVLSPRTLEQFDVDGPRQLLDLLDAITLRDEDRGLCYHEARYKEVPDADFAALSSSYSSEYSDLKDSELDDIERALLNAIRDGNLLMIRNINRHFRERDGFIRDRAIHAGVSDTAAAWTDGVSRVSFNREKLKLGLSGIKGFHEIALILLHEYMHDTSDFGSHLHDGEFYERFHEYALIGGNPVSAAAERMNKALLSELEKKQIKISRTLLTDLDSESRRETLFVDPDVGKVDLTKSTLANEKAA